MPRTEPSHNIVVGEELVGIVVVRGQVREVDLVAEKSTNASESFDELRAFLRTVCNKLCRPRQ